MKATFSMRYWAKTFRKKSAVVMPDEVAESPAAFFDKPFRVLRADGSTSLAVIETCLSEDAFRTGSAVIKLI